VPRARPCREGHEGVVRRRRRDRRHDEHERHDDRLARPLGLRKRDAAAGPPIPPLLFLGFAVACIGGPLALAAIYLPHAGDTRSAGLTALAGSALYALPLVVWLRYSEDVVSSGGLAAFVEAAAGRRLAYAQAGVWAFSYFLYLPYTVTDIVYEMLADVFPGVQPWRWLLELVLPLALVLLVLLGTLPALRVLAVSAAAQLVLVLVLGVVVIAKVGAPRSSFTHAHDVLRGSANVALLFVCGSLPLFLGAEAAGGGRTVRRSLAVAGAVVGAYLVFAAFPLAAVSPSLVHDDLPGYAIAGAYSGRALGVAVGVGAAASVAGLIVAEYLALSRLLFAVTGVPVKRLLAWIAVPFVAIDALSLIDPEAFDEHVLRPSLIALFLSQLVVFAVFPLYRARRRRLGALDVALAVGAFALMSWGLYRAITAPVAT
jgi:amino acid transporter